MGRAVGILRYGRSFNDSAIYKHQGGAHFLFYDPSFIGRIRNDVVGLAFNWVQPTNSGGHNEYNVEVFYRFPLFPLVDMTLSYQSVMNPVLDPTTVMPPCSASGSERRSDRRKLRYVNPATVGLRSRCHPMASPGTSWHYRTEPSFPNSEATPVGYAIPGTASEAGGRAFESRPGHHLVSGPFRTHGLQIIRGDIV